MRYQMGIILVIYKSFLPDVLIFVYDFIRKNVLLIIHILLK